MKRILKLLWMIFFKHYVKLNLHLEPLLRPFKTAGKISCDVKDNLPSCIFYIDRLMLYMYYRPKGFVDCGDRQNLIYQRIMFLVDQVSNETSPPVTCLLEGPSGRYLPYFILKVDYPSYAFSNV